MADPRSAFHSATLSTESNADLMLDATYTGNISVAEANTLPHVNVFLISTF